MPTTRNTVKSYFDDDELARLDALASQMKLSRSDLLRRLALSYRMPDPTDFVAWDAVRNIMKVNADLARLGNLLKLALDDDPGDDTRRRIEGLTVEIATTQRQVKDAARAIHDRVKPSRAAGP